MGVAVIGALRYASIDALRRTLDSGSPDIAGRLTFEKLSALETGYLPLEVRGCMNGALRKANDNIEIYAGSPVY